ncbi:DUF1540 domain-containing protein [Tumebacillus algifaecis]|nr:DUF1540 domain-containing protein [Tumebacillus algifaecis]
MTRVICSVNTCTHYLNEDVCGAAAIDIMHEEEGRMSALAEQTMCKTFHEASGITSYLGSIDNVNWTGALLKMAGSNHQANPQIDCTVASCHYWEEGRGCAASVIEVSGCQANECQDTNCKTFKLREGGTRL